MMNARPVILQVLPALTIGGVERGTVDMAEAIVEAGGRCVVASETGVLLPRLRYVGGEHRLLALPKTLSPVAFYRKVKALRLLLRQEKVDLVHARSRFPVWVAVVACRKENIPLVTTWHGVHEARHWVKRRYNAGLVKGQRVIAVSEHIAQRLREEYRLKDDHLAIIPRGSDPKVFNPALVNGVRVQALLDRWAVPDDSRVILMAGRLTPWKGQSVLIDALGRLARQAGDQSWICVLAGPESNPKFARALYHKAQALGIEDRLRFAGVCEDMPAAYALSAVTVVPSLKPEPFGRVAVESQMMGCPVIGTEQGGLSESIRPYETGLLVPSGDSSALAGALSTVLNADDDMVAVMAQNAREHALACYTKAQMQAATLGVYDALLNTSLRDGFERINGGKGQNDGSGEGRHDKEESGTAEGRAFSAGGTGAKSESSEAQATEAEPS